MHHSIDTRKNMRLGLILGGVAVASFLVMIIWAWQYLNLLP